MRNFIWLIRFLNVKMKSPNFIVHYFIIIICLVAISCFSQVSPSTLPGLKVWLRADSGIVVTNSLVSSWQNLSNSGIDVFNPMTTANRPIYNSSNILLNNKPSVNFNGSSTGLISNKYIHLGGQGSTIFMVAKTNSFNLYSMYTSYGVNQNGSWNFRQRGSSARICLTNGANNIGAGETNSTSSDLTLMNYTILSGSVKTSNNQWKIGENSIIKDSIISSFTQADSNLITLGYRNDGIGFANFNLAEVLIFNEVLNDVDFNAVITYIRNRYTSPVNIGPSVINVCDTSITLNAGNNYSNIQWSSGANTPTITIKTVDTISVLATDVFGFVSTDTIILKTFKTPVTYFSLNDSIACKNNIIWDTGLDPTYYNFLWNNSLSTPSVSINTPGNYSVSITDTSGCLTRSKNVSISFDTFESVASVGPDLSICSGNSITLTSGASPSLTYMWNNGSTNDSLLITTTGQYSVVVTNTNNCVARDTINITISGQAPVANFSTSIGCQNTSVSFTNLSSAVLGNTIIATNWNFGDPASGTFSTSTVNNPFHTFSDTGNYIIRLTVITSAGCEQSITKTIHISPKPTVNFSIGNSCQNDNTSFSNLSTSTAGYSITSLNWNFGDPVSGSLNTSTVPNPQHLFSNQSNYTIKLVVTNNAGCKDSLINIITVKSQVKANFTYSTPCTNTTTVFQDNSIASSSAPSTRSWNFGSTPFSSGLTVPKTYAASGVYAVSLTVTVNGCTSNISKIITIFSPPAPNFTIPAFCLKDTFTAINSSVAQSGVISSYNWKLNNVQFSAIQNPTLSLTNAGSYPVRLTVINSFGCKDSLTKTITVYPLPNLDFTTNPTSYYYINSPVNFNPTILNANSYLWNVSSVASSTVQSPSFTFNSEGTYTVTLNLKDQQGCRNLKTKTILVSKPYLDLAILNVTTIKDDDGYMTVKADLANYGTIPVSNFDIQYQISDGGNNKETWTGMLNPSAFFTYTFNSKSASLANSTNNITCVDIKKVNGISDENQKNNSLCSTLSYDEIAVSNPIPNPTEGDITLPVILNKIIEIKITIYNSNGQLFYEAVPQKGIEGLNLIILPTSSYSRGAYIIKTVIDDKIFIKKFIKISNK